MHDPVLDVVRRRAADKAKAEEWIARRNLEVAYNDMVGKLEQMSKNRIAAATIAKGTIPRWYPPLCCAEPAFTVTRQRRTEWGKLIGEEVILTTPVLASDYIAQDITRLYFTLIDLIREAHGAAGVAEFEQAYHNP